jgi:hypothetical protein
MNTSLTHNTARAKAAERFARQSVLSYSDAYRVLELLNDNEQALQVSLDYLAATGRAYLMGYLIRLSQTP